MLRERLERDEKAAQLEAAAPSTANGERRGPVPRSISECHLKYVCRVRCIAPKGRGQDDKFLFAELSAACL